MNVARIARTLGRGVMIMIAEEVLKLAKIMGEDSRTYDKRIAFVLEGEMGKVKFLDKNVLPALEERKKEQWRKIDRAFTRYLKRN